MVHQSLKVVRNREEADDHSFSTDFRVARWRIEANWDMLVIDKTVLRTTIWLAMEGKVNYYGAHHDNGLCE